jgi:hypothetical protein
LWQDIREALVLSTIAFLSIQKEDLLRLVNLLVLFTVLQKDTLRWLYSYEEREIGYKELVHVIKKAKTPQHLQSASQRTRRTMV